MPIWKMRVMKSGFLKYQLQVPEHRTSGNDVSWLPTPCTSQDYKPIRPSCPAEVNKTHGKRLPGVIGDALPSLIGRRIHPLFVEWMMGFPPEWTNPDCRLSATQLCQDRYSQSLKPSPELKEVI